LFAIDFYRLASCNIPSDFVLSDCCDWCCLFIKESIRVSQSSSNMRKEVLPEVIEINFIGSCVEQIVFIRVSSFSNFQWVTQASIKVRSTRPETSFVRPIYVVLSHLMTQPAHYYLALSFCSSTSRTSIFFTRSPFCLFSSSFSAAQVKVCYSTTTGGHKDV
jgi:hypothetical protein